MTNRPGERFVLPLSRSCAWRGSLRPGSKSRSQAVIQYHQGILPLVDLDASAGGQEFPLERDDLQCVVCRFQVEPWA